MIDHDVNVTIKVSQGMGKSVASAVRDCCVFGVFTKTYKWYMCEKGNQNWKAGKKGEL